SSIYGKANWFSGLIQLEEGRRLVRALSIIQRALTKEFFCKRYEKSAVAFQGEWTTVEMAQVDVVYWAVFGPRRSPSRVTPASASVGTTPSFHQSASETVEHDDGGKTKNAGSASTSFLTSFPTAAAIPKLLEQLELQEKRQNPFYFNMRKELERFKKQEESTRRTTTTRTPIVYKKFAFLTVLWSNSPKIYIDAVRTLAHSAYRLHDRRYRFLVIVPPADETKKREDDTAKSESTSAAAASAPAEDSSNKEANAEHQDPAADSTSGGSSSSSIDTAYLLREPNFNLEIYPVSESMVAPPNYGGGKSSWSWFKERNIAKSAIGFYMWNMTEFDALVYLDADTLLVEPIDELFTLVTDSNGRGPEDYEINQGTSTKKSATAEINSSPSSSTTTSGKPSFAVATNLMARFSTGGLTNPRGNFENNVRSLWFPYINIACMVVRPDTEVFQHMMKVMRERESELDVIPQEPAAPAATSVEVLSSSSSATAEAAAVSAAGALEENIKADNASSPALVSSTSPPTTPTTAEHVFNVDTTATPSPWSSSSSQQSQSNLGQFFEKGIHQPWLDHYLMKFSVRAGYAGWERRHTGEGKTSIMETSGGAWTRSSARRATASTSDDHVEEVKHSISSRRSTTSSVVKKENQNEPFTPVSKLSFAGCEKDFHAEYFLSEWLQKQKRLHATTAAATPQQGTTKTSEAPARIDSWPHDVDLQQRSSKINRTSMMVFSTQHGHRTVKSLPKTGKANDWQVRVLQEDLKKEDINRWARFKWVTASSSEYYDSDFEFTTSDGMTTRFHLHELYQMLGGLDVGKQRLKEATTLVVQGVKLNISGSVLLPPPHDLQRITSTDPLDKVDLKSINPNLVAFHRRYKKADYHCLLDHAYNFQVEVKTAMQVLDQAVEPWGHLSSWARSNSEKAEENVMKGENGGGAEVVETTTSVVNAEEAATVAATPTAPNDVAEPAPQETSSTQEGVPVREEDALQAGGTSSTPAKITSSTTSTIAPSSSAPTSRTGFSLEQVRRKRLVRELLAVPETTRNIVPKDDHESKRGTGEPSTTTSINLARLSSLLQLNEIDAVEELSAKQQDLGPGFENRLFDRIRQLYRLQRINNEVNSARTSVSEDGRGGLTHYGASRLDHPRSDDVMQGEAPDNPSVRMQTEKQDDYNDIM
ncbi:unnamed protein product, partial [Amoebophrya sp. A120]